MAPASVMTGQPRMTASFSVFAMLVSAGLTTVTTRTSPLICDLSQENLAGPAWRLPKQVLIGSARTSTDALIGLVESVPFAGLTSGHIFKQLFVASI